MTRHYNDFTIQVTETTKEGESKTRSFRAEYFIAKYNGLKECQGTLFYSYCPKDTKPSLIIERVKAIISSKYYNND